MTTQSHDRRHRITERRWVFIRVVLWTLQMLGGTVGFLLLLHSGVTLLSFAIIAVAGICFASRVVLFGP